jgi:hypothetical protein
MMLQGYIDSLVYSLLDTYHDRTGDYRGKHLINNHRIFSVIDETEVELRFFLFQEFSIGKIS